MGFEPITLRSRVAGSTDWVRQAPQEEIFKRMWHSPTMEYYSAIKRNEALTSWGSADWSSMCQGPSSEEMAVLKERAPQNCPSRRGGDGAQCAKLRYITSCDDESSGKMKRIKKVNPSGVSADVNTKDCSDNLGLEEQRLTGCKCMGRVTTLRVWGPARRPAWPGHSRLDGEG